jgi:hypothetical protein
MFKALVDTVARINSTKIKKDPSETKESCINFSALDGIHEENGQIG